MTPKTTKIGAEARSYESKMQSGVELRLRGMRATGVREADPASGRQAPHSKEARTGAACSAATNAGSWEEFVGEGEAAANAECF